MSLLGPSGGAADPPPSGRDDRSDVAHRSGHSRIEPRDPSRGSIDPVHARAQTRAAGEAILGPLAETLALLPPAESDRLAAFAAWVATLFDFASGGAIEGQRLSDLNRWHFAFERALDGDPAGQPIFLSLSAAEGLRPWGREAVDRIVEMARNRALGAPLPRTERLAPEVVAAYLGTDPATVVAEWTAALIESQRRDDGPRRTAARPSPPLDQLPPELHRAARYATRAAAALARRRGRRLHPGLGRLEKWMLRWRARW